MDGPAAYLWALDSRNLSMRIAKKSQPIRDLDHWGEVAGPKSRNHWVPGRSAMETARYWLETGDAFPPQLEDILLNHPDFGRVISWSAEPEAKLSFDRRRGEPRNTDLLVLGDDDRGDFVMAVEAKADEPFGQLLPDALTSALEAKLKNPRSQALERIDELVRTLLGPKQRNEPSLSRIRYQLLTATAGLLAEAASRKADRAILAVQEFCSDQTDDQVQAENAKDLDAFLHRLTSGEVAELASNSIVGPLRLIEATPGAVGPKLYVLKIRCDLRRGV